MAKNNGMFQSILPAICSGAGFAICYLVLSLNLIFSIVICIVCFIALTLIVAKPKRTIKTTMADANDLSTSSELTKESYNIVDDIEAIKKKIKNPSITIKVDRIIMAIEKILKHVEKYPEKARACKRVFSYYLNSTFNILSKYQEISENNIDSSEINAALSKVEGMLNMIEEAFNKQLATLLETDIMNLESELSILETKIKMEGL